MTPGAHVCWCGVCGSACAPVCVPVSWAARLACLVLASRACVCWCGVVLVEGVSVSPCFTVQPSVPRCASHNGPRPWTPIFYTRPLPLTFSSCFLP